MYRIQFIIVTMLRSEHHHGERLYWGGCVMSYIILFANVINIIEYCNDKRELDYSYRTHSVPQLVKYIENRNEYNRFL